MKKFGLLFTLFAFVLIVGLGCSDSKKDKAPGAPTLSLASYATPGGAVRENDDLPITVTLSCNRTSALIYYTHGQGSAPDPDLNSTIYDSATPIVISGCEDSSYIIKYFAWYQDPNTENFETEVPFNQSVYEFKLDITKPNVYITPSGGSYSDPSSVTIEITADDNISAPADIVVKYTTDGSDPRTSGTAATGTGEGITVPWTDGDLTVKAYAIDEAGNESNVKTASFSVDTSGWAQEVLELVNSERRAASLTDLQWMPSWAEACDGHSEQIYLAEQGGTVMPDPPTGSLVTWYNDDDSQKRQLMDFDGDTATGYFIQVNNGVAIGTHANSPVEFFNNYLNNPAIRDDPDMGWMRPSTTQFGCGFYENVWEAIWNSQ